MLKNLQQRNKGFTIIEVMLVLAIGGMIMLIVFLAIPALQRNSRNNARNNDAARISASITDCLSNRNGVVASCDTTAEIGFQATDYAEIDTMTPSAAAPGVAALTTVNYAFGQRCLADGSGVQAGTARQFVVQYRSETTGTPIVRCIGSE